MKKTAIIIAAVVLAAVGIFMALPGDAEKLDSLLAEGRYAEARQLVSGMDKSDTAVYQSAVFRLEATDSLGNLSKAIQVLGDLRDPAPTGQSAFDATWPVLRKRIVAADPVLLKAGLEQLSKVSIPTSVRERLGSALEEAARKNPTIAHINNRILLAKDDAPLREQLISERRKIYLDTIALARNGISVSSVTARNPCYTPFLSRIDRVHNRAFSYDEVFNPDFKRDNPLAGRYIIGDFNSIDANGKCRGTVDLYPQDAELTEFKSFLADIKSAKVDAYTMAEVDKWYKSSTEAVRTRHADAFWMWRNYLAKVNRYKTDPLVREPVIQVDGLDYCIGQNLCLCEAKADTVIMVARFVASSRNLIYGHGAMTDFDGQPRYYAPRCIITARYWDSSVPYDSLDMRRDQLMGFASQHEILFRGRVGLPNFLTMTPSDEFQGAKAFSNGIHEFAESGNSSAKYMGSPVSLGCVRLHDYPSKFVRWWTPRSARFFIFYEYRRYVKTI